MPKEKYLTFKKYKHTIEPVLTGFLDFETYIKPVDLMCIKCEEMYDNATHISMMEQINQSCQKEHHLKHHKFLCITCKNLYSIKISESAISCLEQGHKKIHNHQVCQNCHTTIVKSIDCSHSKEEKLAQLEPCSFSFRLVFLLLFIIYYFIYIYTEL